MGIEIGDEVTINWSDFDQCSENVGSEESSICSCCEDSVCFFVCCFLKSKKENLISSTHD